MVYGVWFYREGLCGGTDAEEVVLLLHGLRQRDVRLVHKDWRVPLLRRPFSTPEMIEVAVCGEKVYGVWCMVYGDWLGVRGLVVRGEEVLSEGCFLMASPSCLRVWRMVSKTNQSASSE